MCILLKFDYAKFGVSNLSFQKLLEKTFGGGGLLEWLNFKEMRPLGTFKPNELLTVTKISTSVLAIYFQVL